MNVNKKLGRFKQWAGERMGGEVKTTLSDDFKSLEAEMNLRHEGKGFVPWQQIEANHSTGLTANQKAMSAYVKTLSKREEVEDKEKVMPVAYMGTTMVNHGEDFENDSEFGRCLICKTIDWCICADANGLSNGSHARTHFAHPRVLRKSGQLDVAGIFGAITRANEGVSGG
jgi:BAR domain